MLEQGEEFAALDRFARRPEGADAAQAVVELVGELVDGAPQVVLGVGKAQVVAVARGVFGQPSAGASEPEADQKDEHQWQAGATRRGVKGEHGETGAGGAGWREGGEAGAGERGLARRAAQERPRKAVKRKHAGGGASGCYRHSGPFTQEKRRNFLARTLGDKRACYGCRLRLNAEGNGQQPIP